MVQILPKEHDWSEAGQLFGQGATQGYQNRSDEMALQKAIVGLGNNPTPRQILDAVTNTKTVNPASKQNLFKNYLGASQFEELQAHNRASEEVAGLKNTLAKTKAEAEAKKDKDDALTVLDAANIPHDEKKVLREKIENGEASFRAIQEVLKPNKENIKAKEEQESKNVTQNAYNELVSLIPEVGTLNYPASKVGGKTAKAYAKFTTLTGAIEANLVEKVNRGALSNVRFNYIKNDLLPQPSDTQAEIEGKLEGLAINLGLDPGALTGGKKTEAPAQGENKRPPLTAFERK